jgi:steroid 5-alpha reductase family enzyme
MALPNRAQTQKGWSFAKASFWMVFALQTPLQFIVSLPVQIGQMAPPTSFGLLAWSGTILCITDIAFETIGDWQLSRFRADPASNGKVMDKGLWHYTRHPNYFGDVCVWWGLFLVAADTEMGLWSLPGPLLLTLLLVKVSGIPTVEGHMIKHRDGYSDYVQRTSRFIPLPPKKI